MDGSGLEGLMVKGEVPVAWALLGAATRAGAGGWGGDGGGDGDGSADGSKV